MQAIAFAASKRGFPDRPPLKRNPGRSLSFPGRSPIGRFSAKEGRAGLCPVSRGPKGESGFTLVELVLVVVVVGIIAGVFVGAFEQGNEVFDTIDSRKELVQEGRMALLRMVREIRQLRSASDVVSANSQALTFYGVGDSLISFAFSGTPGDPLTFRRGAITEKLAGEVDSLAFAYYKSDGTAAVPLVAPDDTDIFRVDVFLRLYREAVKVSLKTGTYLRNL